MSREPVQVVSPSFGVVSGANSSFELQSYVELVFVQGANNFIVNKLSSLQGSLLVTQEAMNLLTQVQTLKNYVTAQSKGSFTGQNSVTGMDNAAYASAASAFYNTPVKLQISYPYTSTQTKAYIAQHPGLTTAQASQALFDQAVASVKTMMSGLLPQLSAMTPLISGQVDENSLFYTFGLVKTGLPAAGETAASTWLTDGYNLNQVSGVGTQGNIEQAITTAITAGSSLNTTQTESVRNYLLLFQEFYQSASAVIQAMSQTITSMGQKISG